MRRTPPCAPTSVPAPRSPTTSCPITRAVPRRLSELQGDDPLILTLARGHYCPKEHQQHLELAAFYPKVAVAYTQIATISTDEHHTLQEFRASVGAQWPFLSDPGRIVQKDLDIQEYTDPEQRPDDPAHARAQARARRPQHLQRLLVLGAPLGRRPLARPAGGQREIRPDWDLSAPGLRDAWDAGDLSPFHGWDSARGKAASSLAEPAVESRRRRRGPRRACRSRPGRRRRPRPAAAAPSCPTARRCTPARTPARRR